MSEGKMKRNNDMNSLTSDDKLVSTQNTKAGLSS